MTFLSSGIKNSLTALTLWFIPYTAFASNIDMRPGVTELSQRMQQLHHLALWVCIVVGIIVFGAMFYTMFAHRRSKHPTPATFSHSTLVEIIWNS